jgi:hypothetical protein
VVPPAGHGTMRVTGRTGKFCACAPADAASANPAARTVLKRWPLMAFASVIADMSDRD